MFNNINEAVRGKNILAAQAIIDQASDIEFLEVQTDPGFSELLNQVVMASTPDAFDLLVRFLDKGVSVDAMCDDLSLLAIAIVFCNFKVAALLLDRNASIDNLSLLSVGVFIHRYNNQEICLEIAEKILSRLSTERIQNEVALVRPVEGDKIKIVELITWYPSFSALLKCLLDRGCIDPDMAKKAVYWSAQSRNFAALRLLLSSGLLSGIALNDIFMHIDKTDMQMIGVIKQETPDRAGWHHLLDKPNKAVIFSPKSPQAMPKASKHKEHQAVTRARLSGEMQTDGRMPFFNT